MPRRKTIELVEDIHTPKSLIINGADISSFLAKTLADRGSRVVKLESYSPAIGKFDYIFLFDNQSLADKLFENHLTTNGKFILVETTEKEIPQIISHPRFKILKIGDPAYWNPPELAEKILRAIFSGSNPTTVDISRKPAVHPPKKKEIITQTETVLPKIEKRYIPVTPNKIIESRTIPVISVVQSQRRQNIQPVPPPLLEKTHHFNYGKIFKIILAVFFIFILIVSGTTYWYINKMRKTFADLNYHLRSGNATAMSADFNEADNEIKTVRDIYNFTFSILFPLKNISYITDLGTLLDSGEKAVGSGANLALSVKNLTSNKSGFGIAGDDISREKLTVLKNNIGDFAAALIDLQRKMDEINLPYLPSEDIKATISPVTLKLTAAYDLLPVAEQVFWHDSPKVYLILFQNNMELRPTGGFIGSYGLLTVAGGKITDFKIEDVYTADGQLKGHVDPPPPIRKYLSQPNFFLRDSNFNPDFATASIQAAWFLEKEMGTSVDGVIGVNLTLAQKLMQVVGTIKLSDFNNEEITSDNFFYKVHYFTQANFFPGSTQKKDVLTAIASGIFAKLEDSGSGTNFLELLPVVKDALEEKNILIYLDDPSLQKTIEDRGWAGRMVKVVCVDRKGENGQQLAANSDTCLPDYLSIVEANLGVNKANYFINKSTVIEKKVGADGGIDTTVTISYENLNNTAIDQPQTYVNYLRFFVPYGSRLVSISLNNAPFNTPDIDTDTYDSDKTIFGILVKIAPGNRGVVKINYLLPRPLSDNITSFQLFYQKQSGDKNSPLVFSLTYPERFKLIPQNFSSTSQRGNEIFYTTDTSVDRVFALHK